MNARSPGVTTKPLPTGPGLTGAAVAAGSAPSMAMTTTRADTAATPRRRLPKSRVGGPPIPLLCFMTAPRGRRDRGVRPCGGPRRGGLDLRRTVWATAGAPQVDGMCVVVPGGPGAPPSASDQPHNLGGTPLVGRPQTLELGRGTHRRTQLPVPAHG